VGLTFIWDLAKARLNKRRHRVTFQQTVSAFGDPLPVTAEDPEHSAGYFRSRRPVPTLDGSSTLA
jgi:uncharacterized protein